MVNFKFNWDPMLELHIPRLDQQHKKFFEIGRDIEQLILIKCAGVTDKQLLNILYDLRDFIILVESIRKKILDNDWYLLQDK